MYFSLAVSRHNFHISFLVLFFCPWSKIIYVLRSKQGVARLVGISNSLLEVSTLPHFVRIL
jgi:hypothetical protein